MWIDGMEIEKLKAGGVFKVDDCLFITDKNGEIKFSFNLIFEGQEIDEELKDVAKTHILNYNKIKDM